VSNSVPFEVLNSLGPNTPEQKTSAPVTLVGFQNQGNLGLGYLAATLRQHGYRVEVFDFETEPQVLLEAAHASRPILMGFSLIFQFYIHQYRELIDFLRNNGVLCHFTMGGHFPSLSYRHTLELVPNLDSVVLFEGEFTLLELVDRLSVGEDWHTIQGLAYRDGEQVASTPLRTLVSDLDLFPYPDRDFKPIATLGHTIMPLLASRGCARTCSFCSIQTFYRTAPGKIVRTRKPSNVVAEMKMLYEERGTTIFLFQDDDFPLFGPVWQRWARDFVSELHKSGLPQHVIWKMNCRADAVDVDLFCAMRDAGLYLVYMGLESGNEEGLKTLHKQITVEQNLRAVEILKNIGLVFEYGFMLFDPSSTFEAVRANLRFLRAIVGDGCTAVTFCRMLPYDGTPIKEDLARTGRLRGDVCNPDYDFLDPRLSDFYDGLTHYVDIRGWIHGYRALSLQLSWAWNEVAVMERLFQLVEELPTYKDVLHRITRSSNDVLLRLVEDLSYVYSDGRSISWLPETVEKARSKFLRDLLSERNRFVSRNQDALLRALGRNLVEEPKELVEL
jgi:anaerobic magnesium-protoporphyrin IX monomethyl ester cyclase